MKKIKVIKNSLFERLFLYGGVSYVFFYSFHYIEQYSLKTSIISTIIIIYFISSLFVKNLIVYDDRVEFYYFLRVFFRKKIYMMNEINSILFNVIDVGKLRPSFSFKIKKNLFVTKYVTITKYCNKYKDYDVLKYFKNNNVEINIKSTSDKEKEWYLSKINEPID